MGLESSGSAPKRGHVYLARCSSLLLLLLLLLCNSSSMFALSNEKTPSKGITSRFLDFNLITNSPPPLIFPNSVIFCKEDSLQSRWTYFTNPSFNIYVRHVAGETTSLYSSSMRNDSVHWRCSIPIIATRYHGLRAILFLLLEWNYKPQLESWYSC